MRGLAIGLIVVILLGAFAIPPLGILIYYNVRNYEESGLFGFEISVTFEIDGTSVTQSNAVVYRAGSRYIPALDTRQSYTQFEQGEALGFVIPGAGTLFVLPGQTFSSGPMDIYSRACEIHRDPSLDVWLLHLREPRACDFAAEDLPPLIFFPQGEGYSGITWVDTSTLNEAFADRVQFQRASVGTSTAQPNFRWSSYFARLVEASGTSRTLVRILPERPDPPRYVISISHLTSESILP